MLTLLVCAPVSAARDAAPEAVYGIWATSGTMIEVSPTETGGLSARILALKHPTWREKDGVGRVGEPKTDLHNPDESKRERPFIGLEMLSDYEFRRGKWRGRLYLPSSGSTWRSAAHVKNGQLHLRGYVGVSLLGKTQKFAPLADCNENILKMIRVAGMTGTPCDGLLADSE
jgi:uncharacterized protein (DUF2147 family)